MSATLGGLLKDYRLQKNLSQLEIAFSMGWKEPSRLSRIEQGRVDNPPRELLDKLIKVMDLKLEEKNHLLLSGNYLPTKSEIEKIRLETDPIVCNWPYPAYLVDFSWRFLHWNKLAAKIYGLEKRSEKMILENPPRTLEMVFDPNFIQNKYLKGKELVKWQEFLLKKLILFKYAQKTRTRENWYLEFIKKMMANDLFRDLWPKAQLPKEGESLSTYERKSLVNSKNINKRFEFHIFKDTLLQDPRFEIDFHLPADLETFKYFKQE